MKKYSNPTHKLMVVEFEDGSAQFLMRGQSFQSDKATKKVQKGVIVKDVTVAKTTKTSTTTEETTK
jgi:hypothetical protein